MRIAYYHRCVLSLSNGSGSITPFFLEMAMPLPTSLLNPLARPISELWNGMRGVHGGIACALLGFITGAGLAYGQTKTAKPVYVCVKAPLAPLHAKPQSTSRVTWQAQQHTPLKLLRRQKTWLWVQDVDGDLHWVQKALVQEKERCVVVAQTHAKIRRHYKNRRSVLTVGKYAAFIETTRKNKWVGIRHHQKTLWVNRDRVWPKR